MRNYNNKNICIHAINIAGLGSTTVVHNILLSLSKLNYFEGANVDLLLPKISFWRDKIQEYDLSWNIKLHTRFNSVILRLLYRAVDVLLGHLFLGSYDTLIILGDFPLRFKKEQIVLFHNVNIINTKKYNIFLFHRILFKINHKYISKCIVQTKIVYDNLLNMFPTLCGRCFVIPMPVDIIFYNSKIQIRNSVNLNELRVFYPASFYKHKNHQIIIDSLIFLAKCEFNICFYFTIPNKDFNKIKNIKSYKNIKIMNLGHLNKYQILEQYALSDALIFPSLQESYGLPLVEAMYMKLLIVCSDLPYARYLCGEEAIFFDPLNPLTLSSALEIAMKKKLNNISTNWEIPLRKIPNSWESYCCQLLA